MESIAVVKRRGCDIKPCTPGFGGPVCRIGKARSHCYPKFPPFPGGKRWNMYVWDHGGPWKLAGCCEGDRQVMTFGDSAHLATT